MTSIKANYLNSMLLNNLMLISITIIIMFDLVDYLHDDIKLLLMIFNLMINDLITVRCIILSDVSLIICVLVGWIRNRSLGHRRSCVVPVVSGERRISLIIGIIMGFGVSLLWTRLTGFCLVC